MATGWDSNMLKKLKSLVGKGLSTAEMGKKLGMSKNAVVGKLNRLGWNSKANDDEPKKSLKKTESATKTAKPTEKKSAVKKVEKKSAPGKKVAEKKKLKPGRVESKKQTVKKDKTSSVKSEKTQNVEKPVIKTASKKNNKDLALHELLIQHALQMANLKPNQCRWPIGDPDSDNFHFCGETVFTGKPYCYEHCRQAYQFVAPKKK